MPLQSLLIPIQTRKGNNFCRAHPTHPTKIIFLKWKWNEGAAASAEMSTEKSVDIFLPKYIGGINPSALLLR